MLPALNWRVDAVVRLFTSVFFCILSGSLLATLPQLAGKPGPANVSYYLLLSGGLVCLGTSLLLVLRPFRLEIVGRRLAIIAVLFYCSFMFLGLAQRNAGRMGDLGIPHMVLATITFQGLSLFLVGWFVNEHKLTWSEAFGFGRRPLPALGVGLLAILSFLPLGWGLQYLSGLVLQNFGLDAMEQITVQAVRESDSWGSRLSLAAVSILIAPLAEELLFRGVLYPAIRDFGYPRLAFFGTSVLFAAIHMNAMSFVPLLVLALALTWLYRWSGNLLAPITAHAVFNAINFILLFLIEEGMP